MMIHWGEMPIKYHYKISPSSSVRIEGEVIWHFIKFLNSRFSRTSKVQYNINTYFHKPIKLLLWTQITVLHGRCHRTNARLWINTAQHHFGCPYGIEALVNLEVLSKVWGLSTKILVWNCHPVGWRWSSGPWELGPLAHFSQHITWHVYFRKYIAPAPSWVEALTSFKLFWFPHTT